MLGLFKLENGYHGKHIQKLKEAEYNVEETAENNDNAASKGHPHDIHHIYKYVYSPIRVKPSPQSPAHRDRRSSYWPSIPKSFVVF